MLSSMQPTYPSNHQFLDITDISPMQLTNSSSHELIELTNSSAYQLIDSKLIDSIHDLMNASFKSINLFVLKLYSSGI